MSARNYWIGVISKADAHAAVAGSFVELNHGKAGPLERMREGDGLALYSPRTEDPDGASVQAFTAIGRVASGPIVQAQASDGRAQLRRRDIEDLVGPVEAERAKRGVLHRRAARVRDAVAKKVDARRQEPLSPYFALSRSKSASLVSK